MQVNPQVDGGSEPIQIELRTRNLNSRGAFLELPAADEDVAWSQAEWWRGRAVRLHVSDPTLASQGALECNAEVRWVERRGPKRRVVGIGVLFLAARDEWLEAVQGFLASLVK